ncbi:cytochrome P450 [Nocardia harenae]|uniref:cytochrome P450 n=1 Tax=Nocardia harenae TaxID=358707 RepID=UPI000A0285D2|nr:cytochrome P450 [Nocardia harenae]
MNTTVNHDLRTFVRTTDDEGFARLALADSPRFRVVDLYGPLVEARTRAAVHQTTQANLLESADYRRIDAYQDVPWACALSFEAAQQTLSHPAMSSTIWDRTIGQVWGHTIIGMDGEEHRVHRGLISQAFTRKSLSQWEDTVIRPVIDGLIDRFVERGSVELSREFTLMFPVYIITELLDLPTGDIEKFHTWAAETITVFYDYDRAIAASKALNDYLDPIVDARRDNPGNDMISVLATAELEGKRLSNVDIISFVRLLLPAGGETTFRSTGSLLLGLLRHPEQLAAVTAERQLLSSAMEEGLRWEPPLTSINRIALDDAEIAGTPIAAGTIVECALGVANRDPQRWDNPHEFDIHRIRKPHIAFAWGAHSCLGTHLAKLEMRIAVDTLLDRLPNLRLDPAADPEPVVRGIGLRSPNHLPVLFDA